MVVGILIVAMGWRSSASARATADTVQTTGDSGAMSAPTEFPLCTLTVSTVPGSASVTLDGTLFGKTPLQISNIDTGTHVLLLQKIGYYQKRVSFSLPAPGTSALNFELTAPGRLEITTIPDSATLEINGTHCGATPYIDSLVKPGKYKVVVKKDGYRPSERTVEVSGGSVVSVTDSLMSINPAPEVSSPKQAHEKGKFFTVGVVAGVFGIFMLVLAIIESRDFGG